MAATGWNTVWITGASSGLGLELARLLDRKAAHVALTARSADRLAAIASDGRSLAAYPADVTDAAALASTVRRIGEAAGPIDLAILNAAVWRMMEADEIDAGAVRAAVETNILGVTNALAALLPGMVARGRGHVAIVASIAGYCGLPRSLAYGPTKAALINLAETLRIELAPRGITVSLINPGFIDTPMTRENPFPMPGLMPVEVAARAVLRGLERGRFEIAFPFGLVLATRILRLLPYPLYFAVMRYVVWRRKGQGRTKR